MNPRTAILFPLSMALGLLPAVAAASDFVARGNEPASLLHGAWTINRIDGSPLVDGSAVTLTFTESGEINGNASCNSYFGSFALTGESLSITETGATLMACAEPLMHQEARYFDILGGVIRFDIAADGSLILHAGDGRTIEASRPPA